MFFFLSNQCKNCFFVQNVVYFNSRTEIFASRMALSTDHNDEIPYQNWNKWKNWCERDTMSEGKDLEIWTWAMAVQAFILHTHNIRHSNLKFLCIYFILFPIKSRELNTYDKGKIVAAYTIFFLLHSHFWENVLNSQRVRESESE